MVQKNYFVINFAPVKGFKWGSNVGMFMDVGDRKWQVLKMEDICLERDKFQSKMNLTFLAEEVGGIDCVEGRESDVLMILEICCGSPMRRNSVLEGLTVR